MYPTIMILGQPVSTYGICLLAGVLTAAFLACIRVKARGGEWTMMAVLATVCMALALLGAKLAYIAFSYPGGFAGAVRDVGNGDYSILFGGFVFYGGLILAIPGAIAVFRTGHLDTGVFCDSAVPCVPLGHALGRIGCTLGGCCYGIEYQGFGAIWSHEKGEGILLFPVQPLEALLNLALFAALVIYTRKRRPGMRTLYVYLAAYAVIRFSLEFLRGDLIRGIFGVFSTSQWISIGLFGMAIGAILIQHARGKAKTPAAP